MSRSLKRICLIPLVIVLISFLVPIQIPLSPSSGPNPSSSTPVSRATSSAANDATSSGSSYPIRVSQASPQSDGNLGNLWSGSAYFERSKYIPLASDGVTVLGKGFDEAFAVARTDVSPTTIYLYYRTSYDFPTDGNRGEIGLAISNDGGYSFAIYQDGKPVVAVSSGNCDSDSRWVISPSVVLVGGTFYMVYEGASAGYPGCGNHSKVHLATSPDGKVWTKAGDQGKALAIIGYDHLQSWENINVGTPFSGYFNSKFYVFYHGFGIYADSQFRSKIAMASGTDPKQLTLYGVIMDIGRGDLSWDARVNSHASVINGGDGYYYMVFEGSQDPGYSVTDPVNDRPCKKGNWGWGIARIPSSQLDTANWAKYEFNPIRQTYNGGCGNDVVSIFSFRGVISVFQRAGSNIPGPYYDRNVLLAGSDPYLHIWWSATDQCLAHHNVGSADRDNGWGQTTSIFIIPPNDYLCFGPYQLYGQSGTQTGLTPGRYSVNFRLEIDDNNVLKGLDPIVNLDIATDSGNTQLSRQTIIRNQFVNNWVYQNFEQQFTALSGKTYEWRTRFLNTAHTVQLYVFHRFLDGGDTTPPTASISAPSTSTTPITATWSGSDAGSGIWMYSVQYQRNSGAWTDLAYFVPASTTSGQVSAQCFDTVGFRMKAIDLAGNLRDFPVNAEASTYIPCDYTLSANPTSVTAIVGTTGSSTITVTPSGSFTGTVTLSASATPAGLTCWFSNASITGGSGSQTLYCNGGIIGTLYTVTVTGNSAPLSHTTTVTFTFKALYSFRDDFSYASVSSMVSSGWTVCGTQNGQVSVGNSILTLTNDATNVGQMCWSNIPAGVTSWTVTNRGQYASQLCCYPPTNGATWVTVTTASHTYQFDLDGYYTSYYLFRDGIKVQTVTGYVPLLGAWHDVTLDMRNGVLTGIADGKIITTYTEISGTNNALARITMNPGWDTVTNFDWVTVTQVNDAQPADFIVGTSPISVKTGVGTNAVTTISLSSLAGFTGTVALTSTILPTTGLSCSLNPTSVSLTTSATSTLTCNGSAGTYKVTVKGTSGTLSHITNATITMVRYTLSLQGFDYDGGHEETIKLNNVQVVQLPAVDSPQNAQIYVSFSLDITSFVVKGTNTLTFAHANWDCTVVDNTKNVQITDSTGTVIFSDPTVRPLSCTQSITYTFTI
ncbi:hypothetical protein E6H23_08230 [Candidatus Bathyarchaeota archaeon]|nr:MAG: hypothetical protein E6H23_08230 [Candidatus Bathyarchaeota archaeon]